MATNFHCLFQQIVDGIRLRNSYSRAIYDCSTTRVDKERHLRNFGEWKTENKVHSELWDGFVAAAERNCVACFDNETMLQTVHDKLDEEVNRKIVALGDAQSVYCYSKEMVNVLSEIRSSFRFDGYISISMHGSYDVTNEVASEAEKLELNYKFEERNDVEIYENDKLFHQLCDVLQLKSSFKYFFDLDNHARIMAEKTISEEIDLLMKNKRYFILYDDSFMIALTNNFSNKRMAEMVSKSIYNHLIKKLDELLENLKNAPYVSCYREEMIHAVQEMIHAGFTGYIWLPHSDDSTIHDKLVAEAEELGITYRISPSTLEIAREIASSVETPTVIPSTSVEKPRDIPTSSSVEAPSVIPSTSVETPSDIPTSSSVEAPSDIPSTSVEASGLIDEPQVTERVFEDWRSRKFYF